MDLTPALSTSEDPAISQTFFDRVISEAEIFGPVEALRRDPGITEILINDFNRIFFEKQGQFQICPDGFQTPAAYQRFIRKVLQAMDKTADRRIPLVDGVLDDGTRVHIALPPVTPVATVSLRRHLAKPPTYTELVNQGAINARWADRLKQKFFEKQNILVCGPTGSGKTTLMRALMMELPEIERVITIEDTPELNLKGPNCISLVSRQVPDDLAPPITLTDLVRHSLRMRPDRLVVGEIRGEEALVFLDALSTGHKGSMSSIHGSNAREALTRLESLASRGAPHWPLDTIRNLIFQSVKMIVCVTPTQKSMGERGRAVSEIATISGIESFGYLLSPWT